MLKFLIKLVIYQGQYRLVPDHKNEKKIPSLKFDETSTTETEMKEKSKVNKRTENHENQ